MPVSRFSLAVLAVVVLSSTTAQAYSRRDATISACKNAKSLVFPKGEFMGDLRRGTIPDIGVVGASCGSPKHSGPVLWYKVPRGTSGRVLASTCSKYTQFDTQMTVYAGECGSLKCVMGNDDVNQCGKKSLVRFNADPNVQYYVLVHGYNKEQGPFKLWFEGTPPAVVDNGGNGNDVAQSNPGCVAATKLSLPFTTLGSTKGAPVPPPGKLAKCGGPAHSGPAKWFKVPAGTEGTIAATTCGAATNFDTQMTVYENRGGCGGAFRCVTGNDDQTDKRCGSRSSLVFKAYKERSYYILVHGYRLEQGNFALKITSTSGGIGPGRLDGGCQKATPLPIGQSVSGITKGAPTPRQGLLAKCGGPVHSGPAVWYRVPAGTSGRLDLSTCDPETNFDTQMTVYEGESCAGPFKCLTGNDDQEDKKCGPRSTLTFTADPSKSYFVLVHGYKQEQGNYKLRVSKIGGNDPVKTGCDLASPISALPFSVSDTTDGAQTPKPGQLSQCGGPTHTGPAKWYKLPRAIADGEYRITTCHAATRFDSQLTIYTSEGGCDGPFTCVTGNDDESRECGGKAGLVVNLSTLKDYYVIVHGYNDQKGPFKLSIEKVVKPVVPKSGCAAARVLSVPATFTDTTKGLTTPTQLPKCMKMGHTGPTRWYKLPAGSEGEFEVSTCDQQTTFDTQVTVYTSGGCDKTFTCVAGNDDQEDKRCGRQSTASFTASADKQYWIAVHGYNKEQGVFRLNMIKKAAPVKTTINFLPIKNAREHRSEYRDDEGKTQTDYLIVRRAQTFVVAINTKGAIRGMQLSLAAGSKPADGKFVINIPTKLSKRGLSGNDWWTVRNPGNGNSHVWVINCPPTAPIGLYTLRVQYEGTTFEPERKVAILFNPYKSTDQVYMASDGQRKEYVENETGAVWKGSLKNQYWAPWAFDQFSLDNLLTTLRLLNALSLSQRSDPVLVTRWLSGRLNSAAFKDGLLWGRWSGSFDAGRTPGSWEDSTSLFDEYAKEGDKAVKYGQCWVFSAIFNTAARSIGIPTRSVTTFKSAHESRRTSGGLKSDESGEYDQHIDKFWKLEDGKYKKTKGDSVWNFHVWNDLWMKRPDISGGVGDGWQAADATPQEESFQGPSEKPFKEDNFCGPAPLKLIHAGKTEAKYDADFVLGEANGAQQDWVLNADGKTYKKDGAPVPLPSKVMTKLPDYRCGGTSGGNRAKYTKLCGEDISSSYRSDMWNQDLLLSEGTDGKTTGPVRFKFTVPKEEVMVGTPFKVLLEAELIEGESADVELTVDAISVSYNGEIFGTLKTVSNKARLSNVNADALKTTLVLEFNNDDYKATSRLGYILGKSQSIEFVFSGIVKGREETFLHDERYTLKSPPVSVQCVDKVTAPTPAHCIVKVKNPLPTPLTNVAVHLHISSQAVDPSFENKRVHTIGAGQEGEFQVALQTTTAGTHMVIATVSSDRLNDLAGNDEVTVLPDPSNPPQTRDTLATNENDESVKKPDLLVEEDTVGDLEFARSPMYITSHTGKRGSMY